MAFRWRQASCGADKFSILIGQDGCKDRIRDPLSGCDLRDAGFGGGGAWLAGVHESLRCAAVFKQQPLDVMFADQRRWPALSCK